LKRLVGRRMAAEKHCQNCDAINQQDVKFCALYGAELVEKSALLRASLAANPNGAAVAENR